ncbi:putative RNA-directed DNA polymerase from transposon X-element [Trichonephila clavata]|uniref:Putative RNA-directed DNA polymerase from transposon X-element n=1 Tax=Trichonephila clavata TaxID=2740835 RepID=A0A8X6KRN3_TRICU|nr:putative RNA-directed DNA polymerase from transposon X-element [Trichonephila clavata]
MSPSLQTRNLVPDLLRIFRNRSQCLVVGDFNAKHLSWSPTSRNNAAGNAIAKLVRTKGFLLTAPNEPTRVTSYGRPSVIDFGLSCGLNSITAVSHPHLSSDHNPVHFLVSIDTSIPFRQNCKTLTNWNAFQNIISNTIPGNPPIHSSEDIDQTIENFNSNIHTAINQASKFKPILHEMIKVPPAIRLKIKEKNRLRKLYQRTLYPPLKKIINQLQRSIRTDLKKRKEHVWDSLQSEANIDQDLLHKLIADTKKKNIIYPPLLGYQGLVYGTQSKADLFADTLENSFMENATPYDDDHIDVVDRAIPLAGNRKKAVRTYGTLLFLLVLLPQILSLNSLDAIVTNIVPTSVNHRGIGRYLLRMPRIVYTVGCILLHSLSSPPSFH